MTTAVATATKTSTSVPVALRVQRLMSKAVILIAATSLGNLPPVAGFHNFTNKPDWGDFYKGGDSWGDKR